MKLAALSQFSENNSVTEIVESVNVCDVTSHKLYLLCYMNVFLLDPVGQCVANEQYIAQLKETFATSVPSRIAAFFGEPIQVHHPVVDYDESA